MKTIVFLFAICMSVSAAGQNILSGNRAIQYDSLGTTECDSLQVKYKATRDSLMVYKVKMQHAKEDCKKASGKYRKNSIYLAGWITRDLK